MAGIGVVMDTRLLFITARDITLPIKSSWWTSMSQIDLQTDDSGEKALSNTKYCFLMDIYFMC